MPMVPVVSQNPTNTPDVQAPSVAPMRNAAPGQQEQLGQTLQGAGLSEMRTGQAVALRIQEQIDDANVKSAEGKFIQASSDLLYGDNGYMTKQGSDALNGYGDASQSIIKAKKDILDSLGNDIQKRMFDQVSQQHLVTFGTRMAEHRAQQRIDYTSTQAASRADSMRAMAQSADIGSADQNKYIETGVSEIHNALAIKGVPADSDEAKKAERSYRSQITQDNVSRLMEDGKYEDANTLLTGEMKAGNVEADTADRLRRSIRSNLQRTEMINTADKIFAPYQNKQLQATDLEAMLGEVAKIQNPEQRQQIESLVKGQYTEQRGVQDHEYNDNLKDVVNFKYQNSGSLKGVDPDKWGKLDAKDQYELTKPVAVEDDLNTWYKFATNPEALTLDNVNNAYARGLLSKGSYKGFVEKAMALQNKPDYIQEASDIGGRINYFANQAGMKVYGNQSQDDKVQHGQLTMAIQNAIDQEKAQNHGKITSDRVDQIIKKQLTQQTLNIPRSPWNPLAIVGYPNKQEQKFTFQMPTGATMVVPGSDGKMHYSDGKNDLGAVE